MPQTHTRHEGFLRSLPRDEHSVFDQSNNEDYELLQHLRNSIGHTVDTSHSQIEELAEILYPSPKLKKKRKDFIESYRENLDLYTVWVYYPWRNTLVRLLKREDFIRVRTSRNQYKITREEQALLSTKTVGVIGLSVGQSVAIALTMERAYGKIKIADFDQLDLSNMNRIRTSLTHLGLPKTELVKREIAEIDPFLDVEVFDEGLTSSNIESFYDGLDCVVDECDSLDMKIILRHEAKKRQLPVIMDTSDRGMLDIERYDKNPDLPLLHGLTEGIDPNVISNLDNEAKVPIMLKMIGAKQLSTRAKASMLEVGQTIPTWPQLATSVLMGGAAAAEIIRKIFLDEEVPSGRFYFNIEDFFKKTSTKEKPDHLEKPNRLSPQSIERIVSSHSIEGHANLSKALAYELLTAANWAPSGGNAQPWKWAIDKGVIYLFLDYPRSKSLLDVGKSGSMVALGAAVKNLQIEAAKNHLTANVNFNEPSEENPLVATITFNKSSEVDPALADLADAIPLRLSNRRNDGRQVIPQEKILSIVDGLSSDELSIKIIDKEEDILRLGALLGDVDRLRLLSKQGHKEFNQELRFGDEVKKTRDGIDIETLELSPSARAAISIAEDEEAIGLLRKWNLASGLSMSSMGSAASASAFVLFSTDAFQSKKFFDAGQAMEELWLRCQKLGIAATPMSAITFFINGYEHCSDELPDLIRNNIEPTKEAFEQLLQLSGSQVPVFLLRLNIAKTPEIRSLRLPLEDTLLYQCYE